MNAGESRRCFLQVSSAALLTSLSGCSGVGSIVKSTIRNCNGREVDPSETGDIGSPTSDPSWSNWGRLRPILRPDDYDQPNQIHNPIPILWDGEWYMYAIDGDFGDPTVNTDLYRRTSENEWRLHEENVLEGVEVNDVCIVDGTVHAYAGQTGTTVWTGETLTDLALQGRISNTFGDPGCYFDQDTGEMHLFYEMGDPPDTDYSGEYIGHSVSPDGVSDWEHLDPVIDTTGVDYDVGDPRIIKVGDIYHLFVDYNRDEGLERIVHYYGTQLSEFERDEVVVTGGDMDDDIDASAVSHSYAKAVGDGAPRYIDGTWKLFFEARTSCGGEIWVAESTGPTAANGFEVETPRRYHPTA